MTSEIVSTGHFSLLTKLSSLTLKSLTKNYQPGVSALKNVDLDVTNGELLVLLGPSGCGKTTILRLVAGLISPTSGDILFDGVSVAKVPAERRNAIMVFQTHALFPFRSVGENVAFGLKIQKMPKSEIQTRVKNALGEVQLAGFEDRLPDQLSGGQKQRVALARALIMRPKFLLLDEPLSSLDQSLRGEMRQLIKKLQRETGVTTIMVTHSQEEAVAMGDRIALLIDGAIRQIGEPNSFYLHPADGAVARFFGVPASNILQATQLKAGVVSTPFGPLTVHNLPATVNELTLIIRPEAIELAMGSQTENRITLEVESWKFKGTHGRCVARYNGHALQFDTSPYQPLAPGQQIDVYIPADRIIAIG
ncbi:MAG: ABC-type sugar transport system ATPase subunit [Cellvibrionaceae bacterium]